MAELKRDGPNVEITHQLCLPSPSPQRNLTLPLSYLSPFSLVFVSLARLSDHPVTPISAYTAPDIMFYNIVLQYPEHIILFIIINKNG